MSRVYSSGDMLGLVAELNCRRIAMVTGKMAQRQGGKLTFHKRVLDLMGTARRLHHRYSQGDYRHDQTEQDKIRDLCQWLVQQHAELQGQKADEKVIPWDGPALQAKQPPPADTYSQMILAVHSGQLDGDLTDTDLT